MKLGQWLLARQTPHRSRTPCLCVSMSRESVANKTPSLCYLSQTGKQRDTDRERENWDFKGESENTGIREHRLVFLRIELGILR